MVLTNISQQDQLANNLNPHLPPFLLHFSNGCTVPIQLTKLQCRMLNPFHIALPFRIRTGLEVHPLTALLGRKQE